VDANDTGLVVVFEAELDRGRIVVRAVRCRSRRGLSRRRCRCRRAAAPARLR
jgi:hypothetical protein